MNQTPILEVVGDKIPYTVLPEGNIHIALKEAPEGNDVSSDTIKQIIQDLNLPGPAIIVARTNQYVWGTKGSWNIEVAASCTYHRSGRYVFGLHKDNIVESFQTTLGSKSPYAVPSSLAKDEAQDFDSRISKDKVTPEEILLFLAFDNRFVHVKHGFVVPPFSSWEYSRVINFSPEFMENTQIVQSERAKNGWAKRSNIKEYCSKCFLQTECGGKWYHPPDCTVSWEELKEYVFSHLVFTKQEVWERLGTLRKGQTFYILGHKFQLGWISKEGDYVISRTNKHSLGEYTNHGYVDNFIHPLPDLPELLTAEDKRKSVETLNTDIYFTVNPKELEYLGVSLAESNSSHHVNEDLLLTALLIPYVNLGRIRAVWLGPHATSVHVNEKDWWSIREVTPRSSNILYGGWHMGYNFFIKMRHLNDEITTFKGKKNV